MKQFRQTHMINKKDYRNTLRLARWYGVSITIDGENFKDFILGWNKTDAMSNALWNWDCKGCSVVLIDK